MENSTSEPRAPETPIEQQPAETPKPTEAAGTKSPAKTKVVRKRNGKSANGSVAEALASDSGSNTVSESPVISAQPSDTDDAKPKKGPKAKAEKKPRPPKQSAKSSPEKIPKKRASKSAGEGVAKKRKKVETASEESKSTSDEPEVPRLQSASSESVEDENASDTQALPPIDAGQQTDVTFIDQYANHGDLDQLLNGTSWQTDPVDGGGSSTQVPMSVEQMRSRIIDLEDANVALEMDKGLLTMEKENLLAKETLILQTMYRLRQEHRQLRHQAISLLF